MKSFIVDCMGTAGIFVLVIANLVFINASQADCFMMPDAIVYSDVNSPIATLAGTAGYARAAKFQPDVSDLQNGHVLFQNLVWGYGLTVVLTLSDNTQINVPVPFQTGFGLTPKGYYILSIKPDPDQSVESSTTPNDSERVFANGNWASEYNSLGGGFILIGQPQITTLAGTVTSVSLQNITVWPVGYFPAWTGSTPAALFEIGGMGASISPFSSEVLRHTKTIQQLFLNGAWKWSGSTEALKKDYDENISSL